MNYHRWHTHHHFQPQLPSAVTSSAASAWAGTDTAAVHVRRYEVEVVANSSNTEFAVRDEVEVDDIAPSVFGEAEVETLSTQCH